MKDLVTALIADYDAKYKRVLVADLGVIIGDVATISAGMIKRPKGVYELVSVFYLDYANLNLPEPDDKVADAADDEFYRILTELVGPAAWIVPASHAEYDEESSALYFTDLPAPATVRHPTEN